MIILPLTLEVLNQVRNRYRRHVKVKSCPTLCDPVDCSLPGSSIHGILQARILEWVDISSPGDLPNPETEPGSPALEANALTSEPPGKPIEGSKNQFSPLPCGYKLD